MNRINELLTRAVARVTLELESPLHIGSGAEDRLLDGVVIRDPNGLPCIPGTSIAGALRDRYSQFDSSCVEDLFGSANDDDTRESRVEVGFAHIHDSNNNSVPQRATPERLDDDLLKLSKAGVVRPHVRINHRGTADAEERGLFSVEMVPAGHRFSFDLTVTGVTAANDLTTLLGVLSHRSFQLGGRTRRGLGKVKILDIVLRVFDLKNRADFEDFCRLPTDTCLDIPTGILGSPSADMQDRISTSQAQLDSTIQSLTLSAKPTDFWLVGGGDPSRFEQCGNHIPDNVPYTEPSVVWQENIADVRAFEEGTRCSVVVPGSAIRGALRHRTVFHYHAIAGDIVNSNATVIDLYSGSDQFERPEPPAVALIFGAINDSVNTDSDSNASENTEKRLASRLHVHDVVLKKRPPQKYIQHVAIDRFTQGVIDGALFSEIALWQGESWQLEFDLHLPDQLDTHIVCGLLALRCAIEDLIDGRLAVGSGGGCANGYLEGSVIGDWPDCLCESSLLASLGSDVGEAVS